MPHGGGGSHKGLLLAGIIVGVVVLLLGGGYYVGTQTRWGKNIVKSITKPSHAVADLDEEEDEDDEASIAEVGSDSVATTQDDRSDTPAQPSEETAAPQAPREVESERAERATPPANHRYLLKGDISGYPFQVTLTYLDGNYDNVQGTYKNLNAGTTMHVEGEMNGGYLSLYGSVDNISYTFNLTGSSASMRPERGTSYTGRVDAVSSKGNTTQSVRLTLQ